MTTKTERKGFQVENRAGKLETFPIMSITLAIVSGAKESKART